MTENQVSRRAFLKKAIPVIAGVGLAGGLGIDKTFGALATTNTGSGNGLATTPGIPLSTASYVIDQEKYFEAQNGTTGKIDFEGTDATQVIQSALNALPEGGLVFIRKGVYPLSKAIVVGRGIHLLGEQGAVLKVSDNSQTVVNPFNVLEVDGDNVTIENLELDGNAQSNPNLAGNTLDPPPANPDMQSGIMVRSGRNPGIQNCFIHDMWNAGVWLAASNGDVECSEIASCLIEATGRSYSDSSSTNPPQSSNAIYVFRLSGSTSLSNIHDNIIVNTFGRGVYLHFDRDTMITSNILNNSLNPMGETSGIILDDSTKRAIVRGNRISGYGPGIFIAWAACEDIILEANGCFNAPLSGGAGSGIVVESSVASGPVQSALIIRGNICKGNALLGISVAASNTIVEGNICYNNNQESSDLPERKAGIMISAGQAPLISNVSVIGNRCFDDQSIVTQQYGVTISQLANQITDVLISNNDLRGNGGGAIGELACSSCRVTGNLGYNPKGLDSIRVGSSPFTYTNRDGSPQALYIMGGSVSNISKDGVTIFTSSPATVWLGPDQSVTISHSDPPLILKDAS